MTAREFISIRWNPRLTFVFGVAPAFHGVLFCFFGFEIRFTWREVAS